MKPGLVKIIEKVQISRNFESPETDHHITANACWIDYADTRSSKRVHWLSKSNELIAVLVIMDVMTLWHSTMEMLERVYRLSEFTRKWLKNPQYIDYQPLFTTQDEWTIVKYVMDVLMTFQYWILWISKSHMGTLHHIITGYNDMFNHMDGVMQALPPMMTQWMEDLYFAVKFVRQKLSNYWAEPTQKAGKILMWAHILDAFGNWDSLGSGTREWI